MIINLLQQEPKYDHYAILISHGDFKKGGHWQSWAFPSEFHSN